MDLFDQSILLALLMGFVLGALVTYLYFIFKD